MTTLLHIGFTGTRTGISTNQRKLLIKTLETYYPFILHHGDCIGADAEVHIIVRSLFKDSKTIIHPPTSNTYRAFCKGDTIHVPKDFLPRDRDIVNATVLLIATPRDFEQGRSGTWYTIRYAKKTNTPIIILS